MFEYGDIVLITKGIEEGMLGLVEGCTQDEKLYSVKIYKQSKPECSYPEVTLINLLLPTSWFCAYVNPNGLIRPLVCGDSIVIQEKLTIWFDWQSLAFQGKTLQVTGLDNDSIMGQRYYTSGTFWIIENIDIPKTNKLLMKKYALVGKKSPNLPII